MHCFADKEMAFLATAPAVPGTAGLSVLPPQILRNIHKIPPTFMSLAPPLARQLAAGRIIRRA